MSENALAIEKCLAFARDAKRNAGSTYFLSFPNRSLGGRENPSNQKYPA